jgi:hypothetical protein
MQSSKFGPFIVGRAKGGGYQVRNTETGSLNTRSTIREARLAAHQSFMRWQDRKRQEVHSLTAELG